LTVFIRSTWQACICTKKTQPVMHRANHRLATDNAAVRYVRC